MRNWRINNKEKIKTYYEERQHKNHKISKIEWEACKEYFNYEYAYCGLPIEEHIIKFKGKLKQGDFHKEHVDYDGANDLSNCVPSCKICNSSKHKYTLEEWYNENNSNYTKGRYDKIIKWINEDYKQYIIKKEIKEEIIKNGK